MPTIHRNNSKAIKKANDLNRLIDLHILLVNLYFVEVLSKPDPENPGAHLVIGQLTPIHKQQKSLLKQQL